MTRRSWNAEDVGFLSLLLAFAVTFVGYLFISDRFQLLGMAAFLVLVVVSLLMNRGAERVGTSPRHSKHASWRAHLSHAGILLFAIAFLSLFFLDRGNLGPPKTEGLPLLATRPAYLLTRGQTERWRFVAIGLIFSLAWNSFAIVVVVTQWRRWRGYVQQQSNRQ